MLDEGVGCKTRVAVASGTGRKLRPVYALEFGIEQNNVSAQDRNQVLEAHDGNYCAAHKALDGNITQQDCRTAHRRV